jgi:hypothetical protein
MNSLYDNISLSGFKLILFYENFKLIPNLTQLCRSSKEIKTQLATIIVNPNITALVTSFDDDGMVDNTHTYTYPLT